MTSDRSPVLGMGITSAFFQEFRTVHVSTERFRMYVICSIRIFNTGFNILLLICLRPDDLPVSMFWITLRTSVSVKLLSDHNGGCGSEMEFLLLTFPILLFLRFFLLFFVPCVTPVKFPTLTKNSFMNDAVSDSVTFCPVVLSVSCIFAWLLFVFFYGKIFLSSLQNLAPSFALRSSSFTTYSALALRIPEFATLRRCLAMFQSSSFFVRLALL